MSANATFVAPIQSSRTVEPFVQPDIPPWDSAQAVRLQGRNAPHFTQYIDLRVVSKGLPFSGTGEPVLSGWMRLARPPELLSTSDLVCLIDSWPPVAASYFDRPVPLSSINWQIHLAESVDGIAGSDFLGYHAHCNFFREGFGSSSSEIWDSGGRLLAKSFQTFVVFG